MPITNKDGLLSEDVKIFGIKKLKKMIAKFFIELKEQYKLILKKNIQKNKLKKLLKH
ncbi:hypothetical protein [Candidatus Phytoplasma fraxini]|uniref:hypothetical protein n=1 Tax=Ash yellows phytoplasma TaxID=35780 RepID=UPI0030FF2BF3